LMSNEELLLDVLPLCGLFNETDDLRLK